MHFIFFVRVSGFSSFWILKFDFRDRLEVGMGQKGHIFDVFVILMFVLSVSTITKATESKDGFEQCEHYLSRKGFLHSIWKSKMTNIFLKKLYASSLECPRSYDKLRIDPRKPKCRLLVTHDDYSMMSKLPKDEILW
ncbi:hypothetical protein HAX54_026457 [Datura stramonium]|uniref:Uncharacterized protein n=1 Tax=Datura stramonium TaxID=4076 RepID=A0ABS8V3J5_DATST|nr:hypothetical protein [Datura stramonium]